MPASRGKSLTTKPASSKTLPVKSVPGKQAPGKGSKDKNAAPVKQVVQNAASRASSEPRDFVKEVQAMLDQSIKDLEKKKQRFEGFKKDQDEGRTLTADQKKSVSKIDRVLGSLDALKNFSRSMQVLHEEAANERKNQEKEQTRRKRFEKERFRRILILQNMLNVIDSESLRSKLLKGELPGVDPLTEDRLMKIDQLKQSMSLDRELSEEMFLRHVENVATRFNSLLEGTKKYAVPDMTYADLKSLLFAIHKSRCSTFKSNNHVNQNNENDKVEPAAPAPTAEPAPAPAEVPVPGQPIYSFGTVPGVDSRPEQDPAVVSIIPSFATPNGSVPSQVFTNPTYGGIFVPVTGAVVPGPHALPSGQLIAAAAPQHYQSQQPTPAHLNADHTGAHRAQNQQFADQQHMDQTFGVSNLNLNDMELKQSENDFRQKDSRRNKYPSQGYRRDDRPINQVEYHGSSNGFQRKQDRYQGNMRGDRRPYQASRQNPKFQETGRTDRPTTARNAPRGTLNNT